MSRITEAINRLQAELEQAGEIEEAEKVGQQTITVRLNKADELLWFDKLGEKLDMKRATLAKFLLMEAVYEACDGLGITQEEVFAGYITKMKKALDKKEAQNV